MVYSEVTSHADRTHSVSVYDYDALGRRTLTQSVTGQTLRTVYDGRGFEVIREGEAFRDGSLTTRYTTSGATANGTVTQTNQATGERYRYIRDGVTGTVSEDGYAVQGSRYGARGVTLYGNGEAVAVSYSSSAGGKSVYLGKDLLGSVRSATVDTGNLEDRYEYDAFGQPYAGDLEGMMNLGYTGKPYDATTGLYNYGYRDYRPQAARFTTVDPIRDGSNWYAYVNNDPVNWIDFWGLSASDPKSKWKDNGDGTYTALPGATLWGLYGNNWQEKSGFTRDPTTLQVGETVGNNNTPVSSGSPTISAPPLTSSQPPYNNNITYNNNVTSNNNVKNNVLSVILDIGGKIRAAPMTYTGIWVGGAMTIISNLTGNKGSPEIANNAITFNTGLNMDGSMTLGNVIIHAGGNVEGWNKFSPTERYDNPSQKVNLGRHEEAHTKQYQKYGNWTIPLILGSAVINGGIREATKNKTDPFGAFIGQSSFERDADDYAQQFNQYGSRR